MGWGEEWGRRVGGDGESRGKETHGNSESDTGPLASDGD